MPVNTYIYDGESDRLYPYRPIARLLEPGDEIDLDEAEVPRDGRFRLKGPDGERLPLPDLPDRAPTEEPAAVAGLVVLPPPAAEPAAASTDPPQAEAAKRARPAPKPKE
jgi:hypothetical protein